MARPSSFSFPLWWVCIVVVCTYIVVASAGPSLELDQAYLQSSVQTGFVVTSNLDDSGAASCFVPRCLIHDDVNQRRLLHFGLRVRNAGDAAAQLALNDAAADAVTSDACSGTTGISGLVTLTVKDATSTTQASGVRDLCLYDQEVWSGYAGGGDAPANAVFTSCRTPSPSGPVQGLSAGWQVTHTADLTCMFLDITGLAAGSYTLEATLDASALGGNSTAAVAATFNIGDSCPPAALYHQPTLTANTQAEWRDPVAEGHQAVVLPSNGSFTAPIALTGGSWLFGCTNFTSFAVDLAGRLTFGTVAGETIQPAAAKVNFTLAPFNGAFDDGTAYYAVTGASPKRTLVVSWLEMKPTDSDALLSWQAELNESGDISFRYRDVAFQTTGGQDAGEGRQQNIYICGAAGDSNCVVFVEQAASPGAAAVVSDNSTLLFSRVAPGAGTFPPSVVIANWPSGNSFPIGTVLSFNATTNASSSLTLGCSFGDSSLAEEISTSASYNFSSAGDHTVRLMAFDGTYYVAATKTVTITAQKHSSGGWSSEDTLAVVLGIFIPVTVIVCLVGLVAVGLLVFFLTRGIVPSGGAWWNKDPEYVNTEAPIAAAL